MRIDDPDAETRIARLIEARTEPQAPPLTPELRHHAAARFETIWAAAEKELEALGWPPPFWAFAWAGGQALARWLLDHPDQARDRTVAALGAGAALEAIAAAKCGALRATAVDIDPVARVAARMNASLNGVRLEVSAEDHLASGAAPEAELLLIADLHYEAGLAQGAARVVADAVAKGAQVLIADAGRGRFDAEGFAALAAYDAPTPRDLEDVDSRVVTIWTPRSPSSSRAGASVDPP